MSLHSVSNIGRAAGLLGLVIMFHAASAHALESRDVKCGDILCGDMNLVQYDDLARKDGVSIGGLFFKKKGVDGTFHYLQAVTEDNSDGQRWFNDTSVPIPTPFIDTPPGGYKAQTTTSLQYEDKDRHDVLPWYDEREFPQFADLPSKIRAYARGKKDDTISMQFETWLVCVISESFGKNADKASDDAYKVAPMIGFNWGFKIAFKDVGKPGDNADEDFTLTRTPFAWLAKPTKAWTDSLKTVYGAGEMKDNFNITLGDCVDCKLRPVPEPSVFWFLVPGLLPVAWKRRRGR